MGDDLDMRMFAELQQTLIHTFREEAVQQELMRLRTLPEPSENQTQKDWNRAVGKQWKMMHEYIMGLEIPILERFGFSRNNEGARNLELFIGSMIEDPRATPEMLEQTAEMTWL